MAEETGTFRSNNNSNGTCFSILDDDSLRAVLVRTRASDHPSLRMVCSRIGRVLDSAIYRKERSNLGCSEVVVEIPGQKIRTSYRKSSIEVSVVVDGRSLQNEDGFRLRLETLPRPVWDFHDYCQVSSKEAFEMGSSLFTQSGFSRIDCLRDAVAELDTPVLHIAVFALPAEYRSASSTVGPLILQKLLKLYGATYSVAICGPQPANQKTTTQSGGTPQHREEHLLLQQDMRQCFRAGFREVDANILRSQGQRYMFATPRNVPDSIRTEAEALVGIPTVECPLRPPITGLALEFLELVTSRCRENTKRRKVNDGLPALVNDSSMSDTHTSVDDLVAFLGRCKNDNERLVVLVDSCAAHACAALQDLFFLRAILQQLPQMVPNRGGKEELELKVLNHPDPNGLTPLMVFAKMSSKLTYTQETVRDSCLFATTLVGMGADTATVNPRTGLTALGYFREGLRLCRFRSRKPATQRAWHIMYGWWPHSKREIESTTAKGQIEQILMPRRGPTAADDALLEADNATDFLYFDDFSDSAPEPDSDDERAWRSEHP